MSLQVWLPLNGNLNNQGLSEITSTGGEVNNEGILGKCYACSSSSYVTIQNPITDKYNFSFSFWMKMPTTLSSAGAWSTIFLFRCLNINNNSTETSVGISWTDYNNIKIYDEAKHQNIWMSPGDQFNYDKWCHYTITHTGNDSSTTIKVYTDGILRGTFNNSHRLVLRSGNILLGSGINPSYGPIYFNDFRLYDHCLSAKEVKEISKGLICHYKLSDPYIESTTNYSSQFTGSGGWNNSGTSVRSNDDTSVNRVSSDCPVLSIQQTAAGNSAMTFGSVSTSTYTALKGATVTASAYAYISDVNCSSNTVYLRSTLTDNAICTFQYKGSTNPQSWPKNQWIRIEGTGSVASNETSVYFCTYTNHLNEKRYFTCWQLELKDHSTPFVAGSRSESLCFDSSGFSNNGVVKHQSSIFVERDSPRYSVTTVFNGTPYIIGQNLNGAKSPDALSLCAWINPSQVSGGYNIISSYESGGAGLHISSGNIYFQIYSGGYINVSGGSVSANTWYHVVGTYDNSKLRIYINGELKGEVPKTGNITYNSNTPWSIAVNPSGTGDGGEHFYGKLSDVRIYSTALSDSDIKELYNIPASIDKNGNMYAYEFKEE